MSKGLEELKRLAYENACCRCQYYIDKKCTNKGECVWKTIENELQEGEEYRLKYSQTHIALCKLREEKAKKEQAFEIIKEKKVNVIILMGCDSLEEYNKHPLSWKKLTQEEYDLLKEVLL